LTVAFVGAIFGGMNTTLHPIFEQLLKPWTPPTEAERIAADLAANAAKASWHERNDMAALACGMNMDDKVDRYYKGNEK